MNAKLYSLNCFTKTIILYMCFCFCASIVSIHAQNATISSANYIYSPSAHAWNMIKYGKSQPNLYTGTVAEQIEVYTYKDEDFTLPIRLQYAYDGLVPNKQSGDIGLGWYLNLGGVITREVRGVPDESNNGVWGFYQSYLSKIDQFKQKVDFKIAANIGDVSRLSNNFGKILNTSQIYLYQKKTGTDISSYEGEPDLFHFNFMGHKGAFQLNYNHVIDVTSDTPRDEIKVEELNIYLAGIYNESSTSTIVISTGDGYKYVFGGKVNTIDSSYDPENNSEYDGQEFAYPITAWHLSKIIAPNGAEMAFTYSTKRPFYTNFSPSSGKLTSTSDAEEYLGYLIDVPNKSRRNVFRPACLEKVTIADRCEINLGYQNKTKQEIGTKYNMTIAPYTDGGGTASPQQALSSITVKDLISNKTLKSCNLKHSYTGGNPKMLLKEVVLSGTGTYTMNYYNEKNDFPYLDTYAIDAWGYWNDIATLETFIPTCTYGKGSDKNVETITGHSRDAVFDKTLYGALSRLSFPTGGYADYTYEPHEYKKYYTSYIEQVTAAEGYKKKGPGLRLKEVSTNDNFKKRVRSFEYEPGNLLYWPRYRVFISGMDLLDGVSVRYNIEMPSFNTNATDAQMEYKTVTETTDALKTVFEFYTNDDFSKCNAARPLLEAKDFLIEKRGFSYSLISGITYDQSGGRGLLKSKTYYQNPDKNNFSKNAYKEDYYWHAFGTGGLVVLKNGLDMYYEQQLDVWQYTLQEVNRTWLGRNGEEFIKKYEETTRYIYNNHGQVECVMEGNDNELRRCKYTKYAIDLLPELSLKGLRSAPVYEYSTVLHPDRKEYLTDGIVYSYDPTIIAAAPVEIKKVEISQPIPINKQDVNFVKNKIDTLPKQTSFFTYNDHYRLTHIQLPGNKQYTYGWDATNMYPIAMFYEYVSLPANPSVQAIFNTMNYANGYYFEYEPFFGLKKKTDSSMRSDSYEYDSDGRLTLIKDADGNVKERYDYHLATSDK